MKITIRELKELIREQLEEVGDAHNALLKAATGGTGDIKDLKSTTPAKSNMDRQGRPDPMAKQTQDRTLEEELEEQEQVPEAIQEMVREAIRQHLNEKKKGKGLPPWLKPGFKNKKNTTDKSSKSGLDEEDTKKKSTSTKKKPAFLKKKTKK